MGWKIFGDSIYTRKDCNFSMHTSIGNGGFGGGDCFLLLLLLLLSVV